MKMQKDIHTWHQGKNWWTTILALLTNIFPNYTRPGNHLQPECDLCYESQNPAQGHRGGHWWQAANSSAFRKRLHSQRRAVQNAAKSTGESLFFLVDSCNSLLMHDLQHHIKHCLSTGGCWFSEMSVNVLCTVAQNEPRNARSPQELEHK